MSVIRGVGAAVYDWTFELWVFAHSCMTELRAVEPSVYVYGVWTVYVYGAVWVFAHSFMTDLRADEPS